MSRMIWPTFINRWSWDLMSLILTSEQTIRNSSLKTINYLTNMALNKELWNNYSINWLLLKINWGWTAKNWRDNYWRIKSLNWKWKRQTIRFNSTKQTWAFPKLVIAFSLAWKRITRLLQTCKSGKHSIMQN